MSVPDNELWWWTEDNRPDKVRCDRNGIALRYAQEQDRIEHDRWFASPPPWWRWQARWEWNRRRRWYAGLLNRYR